MESVWITDRLGKSWKVEVDIQSDDNSQIILVNLFILNPKIEYAFTRGYLSIMKTGKTAKIEDLVIEYPELENRGIGSALLNLMEAISRKIGAIKMTGELSVEDADHFGKLKYFYHKHGYRIYLKKHPDNNSAFYGRIFKSLTQ
ncbi:MAG: GNAT family N-acetyltransferase [Dehalococcoidia bacterium]|nr:MAG: GNAT family N-acetyltransferase [Dehalococcoidia bacterium]